MSELEETVRASIARAFARAKPPPDEQIVVAEPREDPECAEIAEAFQGKHWEDVSAAVIQHHADSLPLLTPLAFRYYLPAYMLASLESPRDDFYPDDILSFLLFDLVPPRRRSARAQLFSADERRAIAAYLKLVAQRREAEWREIPAQADELACAINFWGSAGG